MPVSTWKEANQRSDFWLIVTATTAPDQLRASRIRTQPISGRRTWRSARATVSRPLDAV